jgi:hypothetical protein
MKGGGNYMARRQGQGRGWHGDSAGHARAGQLGGRARGRRRGRSSSTNAER